MKKATMNTVLALLEGNTSEEANAVRAEITAELAKGEAVKEENRKLYASVIPTIKAGLEVAGQPVTLADLYDEIKGNLPEGFTKPKVQYALTHEPLKDEIVVTEGKVNSYSLK